MPGKSIARRVLLAVAALLVVVLVVGVVTTFTFVRRPLPDTSGELVVPGLSAQVEVVRDERGVPHIYADDPVDLFMAQGYVSAQDRFFEMDYRRHLTAGRLAELVGNVPAAIEADRAIRTMGWRHVAEQEWDLLDADTRSYLTAYADGVNAYLADRSPSETALEYTVLGLDVEVADIEPWEPVDSLAWLKAMAWDLIGNFSDELTRAAVYGRTGDLSMVQAIYPDYPIGENLPILPTPTEITHQQENAAEQAGGTVGGADDGAASPGAALASGAGSAPGQLDGATTSGAALASIEAALSALRAIPEPMGGGEGIGSNSWVVSGEHTATGMPLLANDPHLAPSVPGIWYQQGLHCRTVDADCPFDVAGFGFAGMPGIVIGHNANLAWGLTNLASDASDFFLERVYNDGTYLYGGERLPLTARTEVIEVNGADPIELTVRSTEHGPLISDAISSTRAAADGPLPEDAPAPGPDGYAVALSWTALQPGRTMDAVFAFATAAGPEDIASAAEVFEVPTQNIVYATTDGDIGYQAPGTIPVRAEVRGGPVPADGTWPRPGWDPAYDWQGFIPFEDLPAEVNPPEGIIVAANQPVQNLDRHPELGVDFDYGYRAQEIRDRLEALIEAGHPITAEDMSTIQMVETNPAAEMLVPTLQEVQLSAEVRDFVQSAVDLFEDWDYVNSEDSAAAAYFSAVWANVLRLTFWDQVPQGQRPSGNSRSIAVVAELLEDEDSPWWDDRATLNVVEQRDEILEQALEEARAQLSVTLGKEPTDWRWGRLHQLTPSHAVLGGDGIPALVRDYVNLPSRELGGGASIVNATGWDASDFDDEGFPNFAVNWVPSMRMVVDLADLDASTWVNLTGNSGHPASSHYDDQYQSWVDGETYPWPFTRAAVDEAAEDTLTLSP
ncbi:penicillin acylase family protein [Ruania albidiflava]|uniref:penicillin acylase family protein n=1 Tax=Ruania albidiflava TaxID=366586 RepID=UPI0003B31BD6|nr:penicillin acylase family protein [Ruania albidiflava]